MVQNGQNDHFSQNDHIPNWILEMDQNGPFWHILVHFRSILLHLGPPTVLWPLLSKGVLGVQNGFVVLQKGKFLRSLCVRARAPFAITAPPFVRTESALVKTVIFLVRPKVWGWGPLPLFKTRRSRKGTFRKNHI